ncbi:PH domain-containing protein [Chloroflexota bacterium]
MNNLIYEDKSKYDAWMKYILGGVLALTLIPGVVFLFVDVVLAWVMFGTTLFDALLFRAILPQRLQIFEDRVKIVLGGPFSLNIPLTDIREAHLASNSKVFVYWGVRFATSVKSIVEIVRKEGLSVVISPTNTDSFLEQLNQALEAVSSPN